MSNYIKSFTKFQSSKKINEAVIIRDDEYIVGGITIKQSFINSYVNKVKKETEKNLRQIFSDQEIAEQLVKFLMDEHAGSVEDLPSSALLGTQHEVETDFSEEGEYDVEEDEINKQPEEEEETEEEASEEGEETEEDEEGFEEV